MEGILHREDETGLKLVVPKVLRNQVLKYYHDLPSAGHLAAEKVVEKVKRNFYWPNMKESIQGYIVRCDECASKKTVKSKSHAPLGCYLLGEPMERVSMDIMGPLPLTERNNRYILVVIDTFTKFAEAYPLPNQEAKTIAEILVNEFICRYGCPHQVLTDQGKNFQSQLIEELYNLLHIDKTRTSTFRPQCNGSSERLNRSVVTMLKMYCESAQNQWDKYLPQVMMAYRSSNHSSTGYTPNMMMLGRNVVLPFELVVGLPKQEIERSLPEFICNLRESLERVHKIARETLKKSASYQKRYYDLHARKRSFEKGDLVWLYNEIRKPGICKKFIPNWKGPYLVLRKYDDLSYMIKKGKNIPGKVYHIDKLIKYRGTKYPKWMAKEDNE